MKSCKAVKIVIKILFFVKISLIILFLLAEKKVTISV